MKWKARYTHTDYATGTTRLKRAFAWLPVYIDGYYIWLADYETLQVYETKTTSTDSGIFKNSQWVNISKRIII